jgi:hypothetical protein
MWCAGDSYAAVATEAGMASFAYLAGALLKAESMGKLLTDTRPQESYGKSFVKALNPLSL